MGKDIRAEFAREIFDKGLKQSRLALELGIARSTLTNIFKMRSPLSEKHRKKLNELLNTNFGNATTEQESGSDDPGEI